MSMSVIEGSGWLAMLGVLSLHDLVDDRLCMGVNWATLPTNRS